MNKLVKSLVALAGFAAFAFVMIGKDLPANASPAEPEQVIYGGFCCDANMIRRCIIPASPLGSPCFCYGQGGGTTCL